MGPRGWWLKIRALLARDRVERELDEELRFHVERETEENLRRGMPAKEARREALRAFGGVERYRERTRESRGTRPLEDLLRDVRLALRGLVRSPGFSAAVLLTLALGIGATTAVYSVVRGVLLRPLPFPEPSELVTVWLSNPAQGIEEDVTSYPNFVDWREQGSSFSHMVAVRPTSLTLTGGGDPERIRAAMVSGGFFDLLDRPLTLGRGFTPEESGPDGASVVVLSHELWVRRFGSDRSILGRTVTLNDREREVVGVAGPGARYPSDVELWMPLVLQGGLEQLREARGALWLPVVGRLAEGVTLEEAQAEMDAVARRLEEAWPGINDGMGVKLEPLTETLVGDVRTPILILFGAVVFVLLVGCANVGNLFVARGTVRAREMAVRLSLGAGRGRLVRQVMTESAVLGVLGGLAGVATAVLAVRLLLSMAPPDLPRLDQVAVDPAVLLFALVVSLGTGLLFGLLPAVQLRDADAGRQLREGARGSSGGVLGRLRPAFIVGQFALALVLLVGAGLLVRSFARLQAVDPGFDPEGVLSVELSLPGARYQEPADLRAFWDRLGSELEAIPGVEDAALVSTLLLQRLPNMGSVSVESRPDLTREELQRNPVTVDAATGDLFRTLRMEWVAGRTFDARDGPDAAPVAVVNETFVRTFLPDRDPVGQRFLFGAPDGDAPPWITIVGVVADARRSGLDQPVRPSAYRPFDQFPDGGFEVLVRARTGDAAPLAAPAREAVAAVDPLLPVGRLRTLGSAMADRLAQRRFLMALLAAFAGLATLLAAVGIYGVMAFLVGRRTRELGIRLALGADRATIVGSVLKEALLQAGGGLALGALGAVALGGLVRSQLYGMEPTDPLTFGGVAVLLVGVALLASWMPAWRASRVPPSVALRDEG